jgi:hypothetical protein
MILIKNDLLAEMNIKVLEGNHLHVRAMQIPERRYVGFECGVNVKSSQVSFYMHREFACLCGSIILAQIVSDVRPVAEGPFLADPCPSAIVRSRPFSATRYLFIQGLFPSTIRPVAAWFRRQKPKTVKVVKRVIRA